MADDIGGVWRTIGGRRVFIKTGQSLSSAMKASGKFKRLKRDYDPDEEEAKLNKRENAKIREYREQGMTLEEAVNKANKEFEKERDEINNKRGRQYDEAKKIQDVKEAQTIQSVSKLVQLEMNDTGDESVDQFVDRLVGKNAKSVEAKRTELNKRLEHASEEYSKYAKSLNYTEKFRDDFEYWSREKRLYAELVHNYDKLHKKKTKATNAPLF